MTTDQLRTEALAQFAKMTRHKPIQLEALFTCDIEGNELTLTYGKRNCTRTLHENWQDAEPVQFAQDVLKPAAAALYGSVD